MPEPEAADVADGCAAGDVDAAGEDAPALGLAPADGAFPATAPCSTSTVAGCPLTSNGCAIAPFATVLLTSCATRETARLAWSYVITETVTAGWPAFPD
jgi:hypothetical protein